jgi:hypothetical protein
MIASMDYPSSRHFVSGCMCAGFNCGGQNTGCSRGRWVLEDGSEVYSNHSYRRSERDTSWSNYSAAKEIARQEKAARLAKRAQIIAGYRARYSGHCRRQVVRDGRLQARPTPPFVPATKLYKVVRKMHDV